MGCGNALTKFRGVATRGARAALLFCLTVVSLPFGFAAPSVNLSLFSTRPRSVPGRARIAALVKDSPIMASPAASDFEPLNALHRVLLKLDTQHFDTPNGWADRLKAADVPCKGSDVSALTRVGGLKLASALSENQYGVYVRTGPQRRTLIQFLPGGRCIESLKDLEPPPVRRNVVLSRVLRREASAYILKEKNRRTRASSGVYERRARSLTPTLPLVDGASKDVADDVVGVAEGMLALAAPATAAPALRATTLPRFQAVGEPSVVASAKLWLLALTPEPWLVRHSGSGRTYIRFGDDDMTPVVTVRVEPASQGTVTVLAKVFDRRLDPKTRRPCGDDVSQTLGRDEFIDLLTRLGSATLCPGYGQEFVPEEHRDEFLARAGAAVRRAADATVLAGAGELTIGRRGGQGHSVDGAFVVQALEGVVAGTGPNARYRAQDCELLDPGALWAIRKGDKPSICGCCATVGDNVARTARRDKKADARVVQKGRHELIANNGSKAVGSAMTAVRKAKDRAERSLRNAVAARKRETDKFVIADAKFGELLKKLQKTEQFDVAFPKGSVARAIWVDQLSNLAKIGAGKDRRSVRYDELTIKWALRQFIRLGAAKYKELRDIFYLPGDRYLRDFKNVFEVKDGIQHDVLKAMKEKIDREGQEGPYYCYMTHDAMKCRQGLVTDVYTGRIVGWCSEFLDSNEQIVADLKALEKLAGTQNRATPWPWTSTACRPKTLRRRLRGW